MPKQKPEYADPAIFIEYCSPCLVDYTNAPTDIKTAFNKAFAPLEIPQRFEYKALLAENHSDDIQPYSVEITSKEICITVFLTPCQKATYSASRQTFLAQGELYPPRREDIITRPCKRSLKISFPSGEIEHSEEHGAEQAGVISKEDYSLMMAAYIALNKVITSLHSQNYAQNTQPPKQAIFATSPIFRELLKMGTQKAIKPVLKNKFYCYRKNAAFTVKRENKNLRFEIKAPEKLQVFHAIVLRACFDIYEAGNRTFTDRDIYYSIKYYDDYEKKTYPRRALLKKINNALQVLANSLIAIDSSEQQKAFGIHIADKYAGRLLPVETCFYMSRGKIFGIKGEAYRFNAPFAILEHAKANRQIEAFNYANICLCSDEEKGRRFLGSERAAAASVYILDKLLTIQRQEEAECRQLARKGQSKAGACKYSLPLLPLFEIFNTKTPCDEIRAKNAIKGILEKFTAKGILEKFTAKKDRFDIEFDIRYPVF